MSLRGCVTHTPRNAWSATVIRIIFPTAIAFTTWAYALSRTTAGRLGSTTYLVPAIAIVIGWGLLGEVPAILSFVGGAIAIGGVVVARSSPAKPTAPAVASPKPA